MEVRVVRLLFKPVIDTCHCQIASLALPAIDSVAIL